MNEVVVPPIQLKPGRERSLQARHLWIFSGAIANPKDIVNGRVHTVISSSGEELGIAYFNDRCSIIGRIIDFQKTDPHETIARSLRHSIAMRRKLFDFSDRCMCRLVHGEADFLPGLIVDLYGDVAVVQIATLGMDYLKPVILQTLTQELPLSWVYERSTSGSRKIEGLTSAEGTLWGKARDEVLAEENGMVFSIDITHGQKTGFFLDQREMRDLIRRYAQNRRVLNCCAYSGGFSLAALSGGAALCHSLDISQTALALLEKNLALNDFQGKACHESICGDLFDYLRKQTSLPYDIVILDPPAFAKKPHDVVQALKGYREINSQALLKMPQGSFLLTCSCSHFVSEEQFMKMLKEAALFARRHIRILTKHHNSPDHPFSPMHPENEYLKSAFLYVE